MTNKEANNTSTISPVLFITLTADTVAASPDIPLVDYTRFSNVNMLIWVVARVLGIARKKSFRGGLTLAIST